MASGRFIMPVPQELDPSLEAIRMRSLPLEAPIDSFIAGAYVRRSSLSYPIIRQLLEIIRDLAARLYQRP
ncbi:hypothetical protein [Tropicimonas sp.]|uniref:hypothetical protein n=1 Tax=Tropicimonas sp. TaxID=2067044 RepID=UPI003A89747A